ncbi:MAG: tetratricopeptide repeat protein [Dehalococcoidia bacterium]
MALRLADALYVYWYTRGYLNEGRAWIEAALKREAQAPQHLRIGALNSAPFMAWRPGDSTTARARAEEALAASQREGNREVVGWALYALGLAALGEGDVATARNRLDESVAIFRALGDSLRTHVVLVNRGMVAQMLGDLPTARLRFQESLAILRGNGWPFGIAFTLLSLGHIAMRQGDDSDASALLQEGLTLVRQLGVKPIIARVLEGPAGVLLLRQLPARAARILGAAEALRSYYDSALETQYRPEYEHRVAAIREALGETAFAIAWAQGGSMTRDQAVEYTLENKEEPAPGNEPSPEPSTRSRDPHSGRYRTTRGRSCFLSGRQRKSGQRRDPVRRGYGAAGRELSLNGPFRPRRQGCPSGPDTNSRRVTIQTPGSKAVKRDRLGFRLQATLNFAL